MIYKKSEHLRFRSKNNIFFIWNSIYGNSIIANKYVFDFIYNIENKKDFNKDEQKIIKEFIKRKFIYKKNVEEKFEISKDIKLIPVGVSFDITKQCNFACSFCLSEEFIKNNKNIKTNIDLDYIKKFLLKYFNYLDKNKIYKKISIAFNGGECLIEWDLLKETVNFCNKNFKDKFEINYRINTNASLVTEEISKFLNKNNFSIFTSLDGLKEGNDKVRKYKNGEGTFDDIIKGIKILKKYNKFINIGTVITEDNFDYVNKEYLDFLKNDLEIYSVGIEPDIVHFVNIEIKNLVDRLIELIYYGNKIGISVGGLYQRIFRRIKDPGNFWCAGQAAGGFSIDNNGYLKLCGFSETTFGNAMEFEQTLESGKIKDYVISRHRGNIDECIGCDFEGICCGGCYTTYEVYKRDKDKKTFEYRCNFYKEFTERMIEKAIDNNIEKVKV